MASNFSLFVVFGFLAVVLLLDGAYVFWSDTRSPEARRINQRLQIWTTGGAGNTSTALFKQRRLSASPEVQRLLQALPLTKSLDRMLLQAGYGKTLAQFLVTSLVAGLVGVAMGLALRLHVVGLLLAGITLSLLPWVRQVWLRGRRIHKINAQLPETMDLISRALRAGHAFSAAMAMVSDQAPEPIASEFKATFAEINFGISTQEALANMAARVPITDMRYFVMAVVIQLETGGNLAELLTLLGNLMRERFKLLAKIQVMAAEGKLSAYILISLPFVVGGALFALSPGYLKGMFNDPLGIKMVMGAAGMMVVGAVTILRMVKIHV